MWKNPSTHMVCMTLSLWSGSNLSIRWKFYEVRQPVLWTLWIEWQKRKIYIYIYILFGFIQWYIHFQPPRFINVTRLLNQLPHNVDTTLRWKISFCGPSNNKEPRIWKIQHFLYFSLDVLTLKRCLIQLALYISNGHKVFETLLIY